MFPVMFLSYGVLPKKIGFIRMLFCYIFSVLSATHLNDSLVEISPDDTAPSLDTIKQ